MPGQKQSPVPRPHAPTHNATQKKEWPIFEIPTEICWYNDCREINLGKNVNTFKFDFDKKPLVKGTIDPNGWVLKEIVN